MELSRKEAGKVPHEAHELNKKTVNKIGDRRPTKS